MRRVTELRVSSAPRVVDSFDDQDVSAESEEDLSGLAPESLGSTVVWSTDWTAATIIDQLRRGTIALDPAFQRRDAWSADRKGRYIESLVLGLPVPQIVLAEDRNFKGRFIVIDGKQRLLSLSKFAGVGLVVGQEPLTLSGLTIRNELNGATYSQLSSEARFQSLLTAFENQPVRTVVVRGWKNEKVLYTIFLRLNTGSVPLSPQELRQALHPGPFLTFADEFSAKSRVLQKLLGLTSPDFRMRDVELVVRFFAFRLRLQHYSGNLKQFLDDTCQELNSDWLRRGDEIKRIAGDFEGSIETASKIFSNANVFRKWDGVRFEKRLNRAIFDVISHSFSNQTVRKASLARKTEILVEFKELCDRDEDFRESVQTTTKSKSAVTTRFSHWYRALRKITGKKLPLDLPR